MKAAGNKPITRMFLWASLLISLVLQLPILSIAATSFRFHTFTNLGCESCVEALEPLRALYGESVILYDVRESNNSQLFDRVVSFAGSDVYTALPLVVVVKDERLFAIVFWVHSEADWEKIVSGEHIGVPVYSNIYDAEGRILPDKILSDQNVTDSIARLLGINGETDATKPRRDIYSLFPLVVVAALVDAVNPCEFYVLAVFLSLVFFRIGRKTVLKAGLAYAVAVFASYYLLGFGLLRLMSYAQQIRILVVAVFGFLGLTVGLREILGATLNRKLKRIPDIFSRSLLALLTQVSENPLTAFTIGIASGLFLLPCTSAPYFVALSLISSLESLVEGLLLLTVYNGIVVAPFLLITLCVHTLQLRTGDVKRWSAQKQRWLNLLSGSLIWFLGLYLLSTLVA